MHRSEITENTKQKIQTIADNANRQVWRDVEVEYVANWIVLKLVDNIETRNIAAVNIHECDTQEDLIMQLMVDLLDTVDGLLDQESK